MIINLPDLKFTYYIPHKSFFSLHPYGRVTHALGVANGLAENGCEVSLISEEGVLKFKSRLNDRVKLKTLKAFNILDHFALLFRTPIECDVFLYRKTLFSLVWIILFRIINFNRNFKIVAEVNGFVFDYNHKYKGKKLLIFFTELLHRLILKFDDLVYVVNDDIKRILINGLFKLSEERVIVVHNGGPGPQVLCLAEKNPASMHFVFFGILANYNELDLFISVLGNQPNKKLHIVGFGPESESLNAQSLMYDNVTLYGEKNFPEFGKLLNSLNGLTVGIIPMNLGNQTGSLSPIKAFDYMSFGMPIIHSDICLNNLVTEGEEGLSYQTGNRESLRKVIDIISEPVNYYSYRNFVIENYRKHTWAARMYSLINEIKKCVE